MLESALFYIRWPFEERPKGSESELGYFLPRNSKCKGPEVRVGPKYGCPGGGEAEVKEGAGGPEKLGPWLLCNAVWMPQGFGQSSKILVLSRLEIVLFLSPFCCSLFSGS